MHNVLPFYNMHEKLKNVSNNLVIKHMLLLVKVANNKEFFKGNNLLQEICDTIFETERLKRHLQIFTEGCKSTQEKLALQTNTFKKL